MDELVGTKASRVRASALRAKSSFLDVLPSIYLICALILGGAYAVISPPFWGPDEAAHALRGLQVSAGTLISKNIPEGQGALLDSGFLQSASFFEASVLEDIHRINRDRPVPRLTPNKLQNASETRWSGQKTFVAFPETRLYPPTFYVPNAVAWRVAQTSHLTVARSLLLARISNLFATTLLGWLALHIAGRHRLAMCAVLLLPTLLMVDGSCSQDGLIVAAAALAIALLSRAIAEERLPLSWELALAALALCACAMTRPPYALLLALLFLPALERRRLDRRGLLLPSILVGAALIADVSWSLLVRSLGVMVKPGADPTAQARFLTHQPVLAFARLSVALLKALPVLSGEVVSAASGNVRAPRLAAGLVLVSVAVLFVSAPAPRLQNKASKLLLLLVCLGVVATVSLAEYLIWSAPGASSLSGVQFRHFVPLLLALTLIGGSRQSASGAWQRPALAMLLVLNIVILAIDAHLFYGSNLQAALHALYMD